MLIILARKATRAKKVVPKHKTYSLPGDVPLHPHDPHSKNNVRLVAGPPGVRVAKMSQGVLRAE